MKILSEQELKKLTMKEMKAYAEKAGTEKVPKKWADKKSAVGWIKKRIGLTPIKAAVNPTVKKAKKKIKDADALARRIEMTKFLKEACTARELETLFKVEYKSILDDLHAIRHNRDYEYLKDSEILAGKYIGRCKAFQIIKKK